MSRTRTNHEACQLIKTYWKEHPKIEFGFISETEQNLIKDVYELKNRTILELRDARDFTVVKFTLDMVSLPLCTPKENMIYMDCKSAITSMIDSELEARGEEI